MSRRGSEVSRRGSEVSKDSIPALKERVKELEGQVCEYKRRLDDLRKAKNTTIVKRQREVLNISAPNLGHRESQVDKSKSLENQLEEMRLQHKKEIENIKFQKEDPGPSCDHEYEIALLKMKIDEVVSENAAMLFENEGLKDRIAELTSQLSVKEAGLCEREETIKSQVEKEWQLKYQEWMARTEEKLEHLQQANNMMQTLLKRPEGRDPTGQS